MTGDPPVTIARTPIPVSIGTFLHNLSIGSKLTLGFGLLVGLTLLVVGLTHFARAEVVNTINRTGEVRVPVALASAHAQANLLQMFADVRGYLAFGEYRFINSYRRSEQAFQSNLNELEDLSQGFDAASNRHFQDLKIAFEQWKSLPNTLFALRDDQMEREPAYRWLNTTGTEHAGTILITIDQVLTAQKQREPSVQSVELIEDMIRFRSSFAAMFSGLRGYVTTLNPNFRQYEYELNLDINTEAWNVLSQEAQLFTPEQQAWLDQIRTQREQFISQVPIQIFSVLESERWREDVYLFNKDVEPLTNNMHQLLQDITESQQTALRDDLAQGINELRAAREQALLGGVIAVLLGLGLAFIFWRMTVGPVRRLTSVAHQIADGDMTAQARIEAEDEIGTFARTFNTMTTQLRQSLQQIRQEKKRADDLLHVVIPIGVALSSERDFNRLLEQMLVEAMAFCHADSGALFLRDGKLLKLVMMRITSQQTFLGGTSSVPPSFTPLELYNDEASKPTRPHPTVYVASMGVPVNVVHIDQAEEEFDFSLFKRFTAQFDYKLVSLLALPLKNTRQEVLGVLQLMNAQDSLTNAIIPFDENLQQMMESFSSLAVAALESYIREQGLRREIQQLRVEIDESRRQQQVSEIVETDFFQELQARANSLRQRIQERPDKNPEDSPGT